MPGMDGLELLDAVREFDSDIPFILFTGRGSERIADDAISAGVTDYLQKGGTDVYSVLSNRIENSIESYRRQRELERIHDRYRTLVEKGSDTVSVLTPDGTFKYIDPSIERTLGFDPDTLVGEDALGFIHPEDRDRIQAQFSDLRAHEDVTEKTVRCRYRDAADEWTWIEAAITDELASSLEGFVVNARE